MSLDELVKYLNSGAEHFPYVYDARNCHDFFAALAENRSVKEVQFTNVVKGTSLASAEAIALPLAGNKNRVLERLDLAFAHDFSPKAAACLGAALRGNTTLRHLNLHAEVLTMDALAAVAEAAGESALASLDLGKTPRTADTAEAQASELSAAVALAETLGKTTTLRSLSLTRVQFTSAPALEAISEGLVKNTSLEHLGLADVVDGAGAAGKKKRGNAGGPSHRSIMDHLGKALAVHPALRKLVLKRVAFTDDAGAKLFAEGLCASRTLRELTLQLVHDVSLAAAEALGAAFAANTSLSAVELGYSVTHHQDEGARVLMEGLLANRTLETLNVERCFGMSSAKPVLALCSVIRDSRAPQLRSLSAGSLSMGETEALALADALASNTTLTRLTLSMTAWTRKVALAVGKMLLENATLTSLRSHSSPWSSALPEIADALRVNTTLRELLIPVHGDPWRCTHLQKTINSNCTLFSRRVLRPLYGDVNERLEALATRNKSNPLDEEENYVHKNDDDHLHECNKDDGRRGDGDPVPDGDGYHGAILARSYAKLSKGGDETSSVTIKYAVVLCPGSPCLRLVALRGFASGPHTPLMDAQLRQPGLGPESVRLVSSDENPNHYYAVRVVWPDGSIAGGERVRENVFRFEVDEVREPSASSDPREPGDDTAREFYAKLRARLAAKRRADAMQFAGILSASMHFSKLRALVDACSIDDDQGLQSLFAEHLHPRISSAFMESPLFA